MLYFPGLTGVNFPSFHSLMLRSASPRPKSVISISRWVLCLTLKPLGQSLLEMLDRRHLGETISLSEQVCRPMTDDVTILRERAVEIIY